jgi:predicted PurR-regulated permease PerM
VCVVLLLALLLVALIPSLVQSVSKLVSNWSDYTAKLETVIEKVSAFAVAHNLELDLDNITAYLDTAMEKGVDLLKNNIGTILEKMGTIGTGVSNFAIGVVIGFCFLAVRKTIAAVVGKIRLALFRKERIERDNELLLHCHKIFIRYAGCTLLDASIIGIATLIFMLIMRMPYAPLIAVLVAITNIIPTFGPIIGAAFGVFFLILDKPLNAVFFLVFIIVIQALDGTVIKTKLFSGSLGIPGVWTMVIILLGGKVAGIAGIILAIPFAAIFVIIYKETIEPRLERRKNKIAEKSGGKR